MADKKSKKNIVAATVAAFVVVAGVVTAVLLLARSRAVVLNDDFFKSDDTKFVMDLDEGADGTFENTEKSYIVYNYSGDKITGMAFYYRFSDEESAIIAFDAAKADAEADASVKTFSRNGNYIIVDFVESEYANISVSEVRQAVEFLDGLKKSEESDIEAE